MLSYYDKYFKDLDNNPDESEINSIQNILNNCKSTPVTQYLDKKIIAVVAVYGREPLLKYTIRRLYNKNNIYKVICVGLSNSEKKICTDENAIWISSPNKPLGKKWNKGYEYARRYRPDGILFVGSGDWISDNWIQNAYKYLDNYGIVGKSDFCMYDIIDYRIRNCHWHGYLSNTNRDKETIGIGRLLSRKLLERINYKPFSDELDDSLDWSMYLKCIQNNFKIKILDMDDVLFLSVSCDLWINKHKFNGHYYGALKDEKELIKFCNNNINLYNLYNNTTFIDNKINIYEYFPELNDFYIDYCKIKSIR